MSISAAVALTGGQELFKNLVLGVYKNFISKAGQKVLQWNTEKKISTLYSHINQVRKVKTIWQVDKTIDLKSFYCDSHVIINQKRKKIHEFSDFECTENVLIQGIAGQGKSILLRHLCCTELAVGKYIPIFIELRRISASDTLKERIYKAFGTLGLDVNDRMFNALVNSGKILLLLDAFDEVPDDLKSKVLNDIEDLAASDANLRIVVTSRPNNAIEMSNHFSVFRLDNLNGTEYQQVINKLAAGHDWAGNLIKHIESKARHIKEMLCTPLMVTLLVISYKSYQKLPAQLSDFYESLLQTLLQRHDGSKPGFTRKRACSLNDTQYREVFENFCILVQKAGQKSFRLDKIQELAKIAIEQRGINAAPQAYIDDIIKITCLIIKDGEEHRFIHNTVQEYYASSFIAKQPENWAREFYGRLLLKAPTPEWDQVLAFLSEIDMYRYNKYYYLPAALNFLAIKPEELLTGQRPQKAFDWLRNVLKSVFIAPDKSGVFRVQFYKSSASLYQKYIDLITHIPNLPEAIEKRNPPSLTEEEYNKYSVLRFTGEAAVYQLSQVVYEDLIPRAQMALIEKKLNSMYDSLSAVQEFLKVKESTSLLDGLI
jgi:hypothetical protein